jgi:hypothetical protein
MQPQRDVFDPVAEAVNGTDERSGRDAVNPFADVAVENDLGGFVIR